MQSFCQLRSNGVDHTIVSISVPRSITLNRKICLKSNIKEQVWWTAHRQISY